MHKQEVSKPTDPDHATYAESFCQRVASGTAVVAIIGMGYVGLPLAKAVATSKLKVIGVDIDEAKVKLLNDGKSYIGHIPSELIKGLIQGTRFRATTDFSSVREADAILICVPTPLTRHRDPDLSYVERTAKALSAHVRPGQLYVLESTTWPGTTEEILTPILEQSGLKSGLELFIAFSPEREDPGNPRFETQTIPKIVGAHGADALRMATTLYGKFVKSVIPVSSTATAEAVKLTENIFRAVNIALVNELKIIYGALGIDVWEVVEAAKTKPFGYMPFYPGPGLGGHCIPIDPFYLTWKAREHEVTTRFIELAGEINVGMPRWVVERVAESIDSRFRTGLTGARILIMGMAYKKNVDDIRESPSLKLTELLEGRGAVVDYHDPFVPVIPPTREHPTLAGRKSVSYDPETIASYDCVLIATDHDNIDYSLLRDHARLVVDTRNVLARAGLVADHFVKA